MKPRTIEILAQVLVFVVGMGAGLYLSTHGHPDGTGWVWFVTVLAGLSLL